MGGPFCETVPNRTGDIYDVWYLTCYPSEPLWQHKLAKAGFGASQNGHSMEIVFRKLLGDNGDDGDDGDNGDDDDTRHNDGDGAYDEDGGGYGEGDYI